MPIRARMMLYSGCSVLLVNYSTAFPVTLLLTMTQFLADCALTDRLRAFEVGRRSSHRITKRGAVEPGPPSTIRNNRVEEVVVDAPSTSYRLVVTPTTDVIHANLRIIVEDDVAMTSTDETHRVLNALDGGGGNNGLPMRGHLYGYAGHSDARISVDEHGAVLGQVALDDEDVVYFEVKMPSSLLI